MANNDTAGAPAGEKYNDLLELAFDTVKAIEAAGPSYIHPQRELLVTLWVQLAVAVEIRNLRLDLAKERTQWQRQ